MTARTSLLVLAGAGIVAAAALILYWLGHPWICTCGYVKLWHGVTVSDLERCHDGELVGGLRVGEGDLVVVAMGSASVELPARIDPAVADRVVRVPAAHPLTAALGAMDGPVTVSRAATAS